MFTSHELKKEEGGVCYFLPNFTHTWSSEVLLMTIRAKKKVVGNFQEAEIFGVWHWHHFAFTEFFDNSLKGPFIYLFVYLLIIFQQGDLFNKQRWFLVGPWTI